jgi:hypothetical protein
MLKRLDLKNIGPAQELSAEFGARLNILTGDNGLGKTFLLDVAWWALTGSWAGQPAWPDPQRKEQPKIAFELAGKADSTELLSGEFSRSSQQWQMSAAPSLRNSLAVYARVDEGFSVWDPVKTARSAPHNPISFTQGTLWDGLEKPSYITTEGIPSLSPKGKGLVVSNGLIRDWVDWRSESSADKTSAYESLIKVLEKLSPDPGTERIEPGQPVRVSVDDVREIPTINLPYGSTPIIFASAGMKRILGLAYLLVWTWYEHQQICRFFQVQPANKIVLLLDELEAHLHPKWQRSILPSILEVAKILNSEIETQVIATTHSPFIPASVETQFDEKRDKVFIFEVENNDIELVEFDWAKFGEIGSWVTSPVFGLHSDRSKESERVMNAAYAFMRGEHMNRYSGLQTKEEIDRELVRVLPSDDPLIIEWHYFIKKLERDEGIHDSR